MSRAGPPGFSPHPHHKKTKNVWLPGNAVVRDEDEAAQSAAPAAAAEAPLAAADEGRARVLTVEVAGGDEEAKAPIEPVPAASPSQAQRPLQQPADGEFAGDSEVQAAVALPAQTPAPALRVEVRGKNSLKLVWPSVLPPLPPPPPPLSLPPPPPPPSPSASRRKEKRRPQRSAKPSPTSAEADAASEQPQQQPQPPEPEPEPESPRMLQWREAAARHAAEVRALTAAHARAVARHTYIAARLARFEALYRLEMETLGGGDGDGGGGGRGGLEVVYEGAKPAANVQKLRAGTAYRFRLSAQLRAGAAAAAASWSAPLVAHTQPTAPRAPAAPELIARSAYSATLQWAPPADGGAAISDYTLELGVESEALHVAYCGAEPRFEAKGLAPATAYRARVKAANIAGVSPFSPPLSFATAAAPPAAPGAPDAAARRDTALSLRWAPPPRDNGARVECFVLEVARGGDAVFTEAWSGAAHTCELAGLAPATSYAVRVRALSAVGSSDPSESRVFQTAAAAPAQPAAPVLSQPPSAHVLALRWAAPADNGAAITRFVLEARGGAWGEAWRVVSDGAACEFTATALPPAHRFGFRVAAINAAGHSRWSEALEAETRPAPPARVAALALTHVEVGAASVSWAPPAANGAPLLRYHIELVREGAARGGEVDAKEEEEEEDEAEGGGRTQQLTVAASPQPAATLTALRPLTRYVVRVRAANAAGRGEWSERLALRTLAPPPPAPLPPRVLEATRGRVVLGWGGAAGQWAESGGWPAPLRLSAKRLFGDAAAVGKEEEEEAAEEEADGARGGDEGDRDVDGAALRYTLQLFFAPRRGDSLDAVAASGGRRASLASVEAYSGARRCVAIEGLAPGAEFEAQLAAANASGASPWSALASVAAAGDPPGAVSAVRVTRRGPDSLSVEWGAAASGGAPVLKYLVDMKEEVPPTARRRPGALPPAFRRVYAGAALQRVAHGLRPDTAYVVRVCAVSAAGQGPYTETRAATLGAAPPPPAAVRARVEGARVAVTWEARGGEAEADAFEVHALRAGGGWEAAARVAAAAAAAAGAAARGGTAKLEAALPLEGLATPARVRVVALRGESASAPSKEAVAAADDGDSDGGGEGGGEGGGGGEGEGDAGDAARRASRAPHKHLPALGTMAPSPFQRRSQRRERTLLLALGGAISALVAAVALASLLR